MTLRPVITIFTYFLSFFPTNPCLGGLLVLHRDIGGHTLVCVCMYSGFLAPSLQLSLGATLVSSGHQVVGVHYPPL